MRSVPQPVPPSERGRRGFSLIEALVALVVFAVGLVAVAGMSRLAVTTFSDAAELQRASGALYVVADSLLTFDVRADGARGEPPFEIRWRSSRGSTVVDVVRESSSEVVSSVRLLPVP